MITIASILDRELLNSSSVLKILWTNPEDPMFEKFVTSMGYTLLNFPDLYYGNSIPNIIICNDKINFYQHCYTLSIQYHIPVLLIDHKPKPNILSDSEKINLLNKFPTGYSIATNKKVYSSWGGFHDQILSYNINSQESINIWKNLIYQTTKMQFKI